MSTITYYRGNDFTGKARETPSGAVVYVGGGTPADIVFRKYTADYRTHADKKMFVTSTRRRYATLEAAAAAVVKARTAA